MRWRFPDQALFFSPWEFILTLKAGSLEEYGLLDRWGESGLVPAALLLEASVQSARWLVEASSGFTLSCEPAKIEHWPSPAGLSPGERFCAFLRVDARDDEYIRFTARQKILAPEELLPAPDTWNSINEDGGALVCALVPLQDRHSPADRACLWREIGCTG